MRSSKNRSRNNNYKGNRNRSVGSVVNRVFDSSGPEGKVRGTPQQIIDKYTQLARDAQVSNDRVAAENFQQHSEHYTRMLGEEMLEQEARRETHEAQQQQQQQQTRTHRPRDEQPVQQPVQQPGQQRGQQPAADDPSSMPQPDAGGPDIVEVPESTSNIVQTPERSGSEKISPKPRHPHRTRKPEADASDVTADATADAPSQDAAE